jgi:CheY-like chemotaxis protein
MGMTTTVEAIAEPGAKTAAGPQNGAERRKRRRAKISAQVHISTAAPARPYEEVCMTVDISRDGLLFTSDYLDYVKGQTLNITFPYSRTPNATDQSQKADVIRVVRHSDGKFGVGVQFHAANLGAKDEKAASSYSRKNPVAPIESPASLESTVLIVEPDRRTAEMLINMFQQDGYNVVVVANAEQALAILRTTVPVAFIAEVEGSDMSGQDLCLIIKRNERLQRVPVILLTRSAQPADYSASHQLGAVVCMAKPFQPERLQHVVRLVAPPPTLKNSYSSRTAGVMRNL